MDSSNTREGVLVVDVPPSSLVGIDLIAFSTPATSNFRGIRHIPPGLHFVFTSTTAALSIRHGSWFRVPDEDEEEGDNQPPLFIKRWSADDEALVSIHDGAELASQ